MSNKKLGLTSEGLETEEELQDLLVRIADKHPIELEGRINTLDKPLIIDCACPGWQPKYWGPPRAYPGQKPLGYKEGGIRYPAVPCTIEEQAHTIIEAVKAGAATVHIHPRNPKNCLASHDPQLLKQVYDKVFEEVDPISIQHTWQRTEDREVDYTSSYAKELLKMGNGSNRYCQGAVVLWPPADDYPYQYTKYVQDGVRFMEEHDIRPVHMIRNTYSARKLKRVLIDTKVLTKKPFILVHDMGHPFGWPMDMDPWMPIDLIISIVQTKQRLGEDNVIGVFSGGRNWMPITMTAILAGVDFVRVGIEDCYWMYPHKDKVIQSNIEAVKKIVNFCELIDREIATIDKAREILAIKHSQG
jgi:3-keto-5-aminohexanoate cleavage enzyme